jgi:hypothetical protein
VRPELTPAAAKLYEAGRGSLKASKTKDAVAQCDASAKMTDRVDRAAAAWLFGRIGEVFETGSQWKEACGANLAALELLKQSGDAAAQSRVLSALGHCNEKQNDFATAKKWYDQTRQPQFGHQGAVGT